MIQLTMSTNLYYKIYKHKTYSVFIVQQYNAINTAVKTTY